MSTITGVSLCSALLTSELSDMIDKDDESHPFIKEKRMIAIAILLINLMDRTTKALLNKQMRKFDANPGDSGCQLQAIHLNRLLRSEELPALLEEANELKKLIKPIRQMLHLRNGKKMSSAKSFFHQQFDGITLSKEMVFLFKMFLLTATKVKHHVEDNGIIVTHLDISGLDHLSKGKMQTIPCENRHELLSENAASLSEFSTKNIQKIAKSLTQQNLLANEILADVRKTKPQDDHRHVQKHVSCLFFQMEVILQDLKERKEVIAVKTIEKSASPQHFFFQASEEGFTPISTDELKQDQPIVVFEAVIKQPEKFLENVNKLGFEEIILCCSAKAPPFDSKSTLEDVTDERALARIKAFKDRAEKVDFILIAHVFCNLLKHEIRGDKK